VGAFLQANAKYGTAMNKAFRDLTETQQQSVKAQYEAALPKARCATCRSPRL
jgi:cytochrome c556